MGDRKGHSMSGACPRPWRSCSVLRESRSHLGSRAKSTEFQGSGSLVGNVIHEGRGKLLDLVALPWCRMQSLGLPQLQLVTPAPV